MERGMLILSLIKDAVQNSSMKSVNSVSYRAIGEDFFPSYYSVFYYQIMKIIYFSSCFGITLLSQGE